MPLVRSLPSLMLKKSLTVLVMCLLVFLFIMPTPFSVHAEEPTVKDSYPDEKPDSQNDVGEKEDRTEYQPPESKSLGWILVKLVFYTLLILVMIYALIKFLAIKQKKLQPNQAVKLMGGTPLGNNKSLQLVKVGEKVYLLGVADQVTLIKEFSETDEITSIESDLETQPTLFTSPLVKFANTVVDFSKEKVRNRVETKPTGNFEQLFKQSLSKQKAKQDQITQDLNEADEEKDGKST